MQLSSSCTKILDAALAGKWPNVADCRYLLALPEDSLEIQVTRNIANAITRRLFHNDAIIAGQIGIDVFPCPGRCGFCAFGEGHTGFSESHLSLEETVHRAHEFADGGDLHTLFLMFMHTYDFARLLSMITAVHDAIPAHTRIIVNMGDFDGVQAQELKAAGAKGAYHVLRLREGIDNILDPQQRLQTFQAIRDADLELSYCCEPIGPEHTPDELVEQIFIGIRYGCAYHGAMRRVAVPGTPLAVRGEITELKLAQVTAVVALAAMNSSEYQRRAHRGERGEGDASSNPTDMFSDICTGDATPSTRPAPPYARDTSYFTGNLRLISGANGVCAETGFNPRDTEIDTTKGRGLDMAACRSILHEAGFTALRRGDGRRVPLTQ
jgi:biotin synthase